MSDPYTILGVSDGAGMEEIRARYLYLAKKYHPDKSMHLDEKTRRTHEETFQKVSAAYQYLSESGTGSRSAAEAGPGQGQGPGPGAEESTGMPPFDWRAIWSRLTSENMMQTFKNLLHTSAVGLIRNNPRIFRTKLTLSEIHKNAPKTYRLWIGNGVPFMFTLTPEEIIECEDWTYEVMPGIEVIATAEKHPVYRMDGYDLYMNRSIRLQDYMLGCTIMIPPLDTEGSSGSGSSGSGSESESEGEERISTVERPPFWDIEKPMTVHGAGLCGKGDLIILWDLELPLNAPNAVNELHTILGKLSEPG